MEEFDHYEFYKEFYLKEQDRRQEVSNALNIPLAIITGLIAGFYVLITTFSYDIHWMIIALFVLLLLGAVGFLFAGIYWLVLAFVSKDGFFKIIFDSVFEYKTIDFLLNIRDWHAQSHAANMYYDAAVPEIEKKADKDLRESLIAQFIEKADHNATVNDQKLSYVFNCKMFLIYSILLSAAAFIPYLISFFFKDDAQKIKIESGIVSFTNAVPTIDSLTQKNEQSTKQSEFADSTHADTNRTAPATGSVPSGKSSKRGAGTTETTGASIKGNQIDTTKHFKNGRTTQTGNTDAGTKGRASKAGSIPSGKRN